jgi:dienelactone hydrolase
MRMQDIGKWLSIGTFAAVLAAGSLGAGALRVTPGLKITVTPAAASYGEPFDLRIEGLRPGERVTVKAASVDARKAAWEAKAVFEADTAGVIDVARRAPVSGDYAEADIFGLLWSMKPGNAGPAKRVGYRDDEINGWAIDFTATDAQGISASTRFRCAYQKPDQALVRVPLEKDGLRGFLYHPAAGGPFPGVIILGGSTGGLFEWLAQGFAARGFAALTVAYFNYPGMPEELVEIPVEFVHKAAEWMRSRPQVRPDRLGLAGGSKGGELALLAAAHFDDFRAVVAWTPAAHVWEGLSRKYFSPDYAPVSSWSLGGKPLAFVPFGASAEDKAKEMKGELTTYVPMHIAALAKSDPALLERARIPVERIKAPILLVSGTEDHTWPAGDFCEIIMARLKKTGFAFEVKHVSNQGGGHPSFLPWLMTAGRGGGVDGGSPKANVRGGYRSWAETIAFLRRYLK